MIKPRQSRSLKIGFWFYVWGKQSKISLPNDDILVNKNTSWAACNPGVCLP